MITYHLKNHKPKCDFVTNRVELRLKASTKKDLSESLSLSLGFSTNLARFALKRKVNTYENPSPVSKPNSPVNSVVSGLQPFVRRVCGITHYGYALSKLHNQARKTKSTQTRFDVIRSPFVFKKTREQFGLEKHVCTWVVYLNAQEQAHLQSQLSQLRLPGELTCAVTN